MAASKDTEQKKSKDHENEQGAEHDQSGSTVNLNEREEEEADRRAGLRAAVVFESVRREGDVELQRKPIALGFSGLASGFSMTLSLIVTALIRARLPDAPWALMISNLGYTVGFLATILGRQQLFTENTVTAVIPVLDDVRSLDKWVKVGRLWVVILFTNLLGAALLTAALAHSDVFDDATKQAMLQIGKDAIVSPPMTIFLKALVAGWMIALMVWMLPTSEGSRVLVISIVTYVVGLGQLSHVIAGSAEVFYAVASGAVSVPHYLAGFLLPCFLGNSLGGVILVSLVNYGQVAFGSEAEETAAKAK
jgi:formate/nitrite transporter FocA (FNT family)